MNCTRLREKSHINMQSDKSEDVDRGVRVYVPFVRVIQVLQKNRPNKASIILDVYDVHAPPDTVCVPASSSSSSSSSWTQVVRGQVGSGGVGWGRVEAGRSGQQVLQR